MYFYLNNVSHFLFFFFEIKFRIFYIILSILFTFIICYLYKEQLIYLLTNYLLYNMASHRFIFTKLTQILITYIKFSIFLSIYINIPFIILHWLYFFITALYKHEFIIWFYWITFSIFIYLFSIIITYHYIFPSILNLFLNFEKYNFFFPLHFEAKIEEFIAMMYFLFLNMIFCFQIPIIINLLIYLKKVELDFIIKNRKICYFILFNFSALISPPEILNQIFIYLLLLFLFEIVILYNYFNYYLNN